MLFIITKSCFSNQLFLSKVFYSVLTTVVFDYYLQASSTVHYMEEKKNKEKKNVQNSCVNMKLLNDDLRLE